MENSPINNKKTFGIILRATDEDIGRISDFISSLSKVYIVYAKKSNAKLFIREGIA